MVDSAWRGFFDEIARWHDAGRDVDFWWRDDDACRPTPALTRLLALSGGSGVPLALAAVPAFAESAAFDDMPTSVAVLQHGVDHRDRACATEKKTEFHASEFVDTALQRLVAGRTQLEAVAGPRVLPVLVPPWNRLSAALMPRLAAAGYLGISTFGVRKVTNQAHGLRQVNTHVDIIDWRGGRGFAGTGSALGQATRHLAARRAGEADASEPTGWLTHHAVHDDASWSFLDRLFEATQGISGVYWRSPEDVFIQPPGR